MKAKKALKRLKKVETLLSNVIEQYAARDGRVRDLLGTARASVARAKDSVHLKVARGARKPPVKAQESRQRHITAEGRKRLSLAAKKRWALAKRKGVHAVTGRPLRKTA